MSIPRWGVFPHAERGAVTGRGFVARPVDEFGGALDYHNYFGIQAVRLCWRASAAERYADHLNTSRSNR